MQNMNMKNKKIIVTSIIVAVLVVATLGATYAYFQARIGTGSSTSTKVTASTLDSLTFATGNAITLEANQTNFASGKTNVTGTTSAKATLTSNDASNTSTEHYNLFLNISDNNFKYSVSESTPELILTIKDGDNNEVTSVTGLEHKTVTDGKGNQISGFDVTTKTGLITILNNKEITASPTKEETWNVTVTFVNYAKDQTGNENKSFEAQILITKDDFNSYSPNIINSLSVTRSSGNLTVKLNLNEGTDEIDKYYFAIKEKDSLAMATNKKSKVMMLSNKILAENSLTYVESSTNTHTFSNISDSGEYEIYAYAVDKKKLKTNTYNYSLTSSSYTLPVINSVTTTASDSSIKIDVSATKGSNAISKYYYSIDSGNTYVESTSNSYTFTGLKSGINYRIIVKVIDSNNKYSNIYVVNEKIATSTSNLIKFKYEDTEYYAEKGMTLSEWGESDYNTFGYDIDSTDEENNKIIEENINYYNSANKTIEWHINSVTEGVLIETLSEKNLKTIYSKNNYNAIGKTFGYLSKLQPDDNLFDYNLLNSYAVGLSEQQQDAIKNLFTICPSTDGVLDPTFFVNLDTSLVSKDNEGYFNFSIKSESFKKTSDGYIIMLIFDGTSENFSIINLDSSDENASKYSSVINLKSYDEIFGKVEIKTKVNFAYVGLTCYESEATEE